MAHPIYERIYYKYLHLYEDRAKRNFKPEHKEWQMFITSLAKYAETIDEGYCALRTSKNYVCMVHLIRMMCDACFEGYRLLIVNDKDAYLAKYLYDEGNKPLNKFRCGNDNVTTTLLKEKMANEYGDAMGKVYELSNRFIHPTNFYFRDYSLDNRKVIEHKEQYLLGDYSDLYLKKNVSGIDGIMEALNEVLLDILEKLTNYIEPVKQLPTMIDLRTHKIVKNPRYKDDDEKQ